MSDVNDILKEVEESLGPLEDIEARKTAVDPGICTVRVENAYLNRSQSGRKQLTAYCVVLKHEREGNEGKTYYKNWGLETTENISWLKSDLINLGIEPPKNAQDLLRVCKELQGIVFEATLVENRDNQFPPNMYINRGARRDGEEPSSSSSVPF